MATDEHVELNHMSGKYIAQVTYPRYLALWLYRNPDLWAMAFEEKCPTCQGLGIIGTCEFCPRCEGDGYLSAEQVRDTLAAIYARQMDHDKKALHDYLVLYSCQASGQPG